MIEFYPFDTFRLGGREALEKIDAAFTSGKKFVFVDAPTGSGKSGLAVAVARKYKSVILTPTKILQEQYANTKQFEKEYTIKGKTNYNCGLKGLEHFPVDESVCISDKITHESRSLIQLELPNKQTKISRILKGKCAEQGICPYYTKVYNIGKVPGAILNYDLFFRLKKYPGQEWGTDMGDTLVLDEAHQLIDKAREIFGFKFSNIAAQRLIGKTGLRKKHTGVTEEPVAWLERVLEIVKARLQVENDPKKASKLDSFAKRAGYILEQEIQNDKKFFLEDSEEEFEIKPLDLRYLRGKIFYPFKRVLMLSATFPFNFKEIFGIPEEEAEVISIESTFPKSIRPIIFPRDLPKMNRDTVLTSEQPAISLLNQILETHKDHKGIVHTSNYKFMGQLKKLYRGNKRFIWVDQDMNKDEAMERHAKAKVPTILVSPSMMEGVDLKDDLARFGIILKVPYPMLDEYTKRLMRIYPSWYDNLTATNLLQAYGRQVRDEKDWARFYILDGAFWNCISKSKQCYSPYFLEAVQAGELNKLMTILKKEESRKW